MAAMDLIMGTVELPEDMVAELVRNSEYGARVLRNLKERMESAVGDKNRITVGEVFAVINAELDAFEAGTDPATWRKSATDGAAEARTAARRANAARANAKPVADSPQA